MNLVDLVLGAWMEGWEAALDAVVTPPYDHGEEARAAALKNSPALRTLRDLPNVVVTDSGAIIWIVDTFAKMENPPKFIGIDPDHFLAIQSRDPRERVSNEKIIEEVEKMRFHMRGGDVSEISSEDPDFN